MNIQIYLKIFGSIFIIISTTYVGVNISRLAELRKQELMNFKKAFLLFDAEIVYSSEQLEEAAYNVAQKITQPLKELFNTLSKEMQAKKSNTVNEIWEKTLLIYYKKSNLTQEDLNSILLFGKTLGYLDKTSQTSNIKIQIEYIDETIETITKQESKNSRMYKSLGLLGGILLTVILM